MGNNTYIENKGVFTLLYNINETEKINPILSFNDKTPLWDGELFLYSDKNWKNENLKYVIPVQIKTRTVEHYNDSFYVDKDEIDTYKLKKGILYFVIKINRGKIKVFYTVLTKFDIEKANKEINKAKKYKLQLKEFPVEKNGEIYSICKDAGY